MPIHQRTVFRLLTVTCLALCVVACQRPPASVASPTERHTTSPRTTAWLLMATAASRPLLAAAREDVTVRDRGWWRAGDGSLSVRLRRSIWQALPCYESGGLLIVEGTPGETVQLDLRNNTAHRMEVVVDWNGQDTNGQLGFPTQRKGHWIDPGQTFTLKSLTLGSAVTANPMLQHEPAAQDGVARLTVFTASAAPSAMRPVRVSHRHQHQVPVSSTPSAARDYEYR
jgi:hypothetical protein